MNPQVIDTSLDNVQKLGIQSKNVVLIDDDITYLMLNYDKDNVCDDDQLRGVFSSLVLDPNSRNVVAIGPPKPIPYDLFSEMYKEEDQSLIVCEPMIEGVFIQLFFNPEYNLWDITTRNSISGKYSYYRMKNEESLTFREMFYDALSLQYNQSLSDCSFIESLDKKSTYHFMLQHPKNHLVYPIEYPKLFVIGKTNIHHDGIVNNVFIENKKQLYDSLKNSKYYVNRFLNYSINETEDKLKKYLECDTMSENQIGFVFTNLRNGQQTTILHPNYEGLLTLRGTHPNLLFQYVCLRKIDKVIEFLKHFPMYKDKFWTFKKMYDSLIINLHKAYYSNFIIKQQKFINKHYYYHIQQVHNSIFIPSLSNGEKIVIKKPIIANYIMSLEPGCVFHLLQQEEVNLNNPVMLDL